MLEIIKELNGSGLLIYLKGRLDISTSPQLEEVLDESLGDDVESLVVDAEGLEYVSSAGLRVLLSTHKKMSAKGGLTLRNVTRDVMEVFELTGFSEVLNIER